MNVNQLPRTIRSADPQAVERGVIDLALEWTAAGRLDYANRLLALLFQSGWDLSANSIVLKAFQIPWFLTGARPILAPACAETPESIEARLWWSLFGRRWHDAYLRKIETRDLAVLSGHDLRVRATLLAYDEERPGRVAPREKLVMAYAGLGRFLAERAPGEDGYVAAEARLGRVLLALELGEPEAAKRELIDWAESYASKSSSALEICQVLSHREVVKILLVGQLAPVWGHTSERCEETANEIELAFRRRLDHGQALAYRTLPWRKLLDALSTEAFAADHWFADTRPPREEGLARAPAADAAIEGAETRLGLTLPESYRAFLKTSNGLRSYSDFTGVPILAVEETGWLRDLDPFLIEVYSNCDFGDIPAKLPTALLIGRDQGTSRLLLLPGDNSNAEWECWFMAHWVPGERRYRTFRFFIEDIMQRFDTT